jgi:hypothetical protein
MEFLLSMKVPIGQTSARYIRPKGGRRARLPRHTAASPTAKSRDRERDQNERNESCIVPNLLANSRFPARLPALTICIFLMGIATWLPRRLRRHIQ